MSGSFQFPMSSEDVNPEPIKMDMKEEMSSTENDSAEAFTREETTWDVDEIEIKHEEIDFNLETMPSSAHVECESTEAEKKDLNNFYHDLLLCDRDCETCVKYMRMLSEHVKATHAPPQPIQDPLLIDPALLTDQSSSSIQIKSEEDENIVEMDSSDSEEVRAENSDSDPDYGIESDSDSDPDYAPIPSLTPKPPHQGKTSVKESRSRSLKSKKENLPFRDHLKCKECGKSFEHKAHLMVHMRFHTGEKPFKCDSCEKSFTRSKHLTEHLRIHTGEKPFKCDVCLKSFTQHSSWTKHKRIHTGERPYQCDVCEVRFTESTHLTVHKRIHTGERPYKCEECEKSFTSSNILTKHKKTHSGEKPFQCNVCKRGFTMKGALTTHSRIHTGEKPFKCNLCVKSFTQKSNLIAHQRNHTGEILV